MPRLITLFLLLLCAQLSFGQDTIAVEKISDRIFMPSIQMGYINNRTDQLSGGIFLQTSIEYQTPKGIFFRLNYDDFDSDYDLSSSDNTLGAIRGKVSFSELLLGIGGRYRMKKQHILAIIQSGIRFYSFPFLNLEGNDIILELENRNILVNRYTFGYEYEIDETSMILFNHNITQGNN